MNAWQQNDFISVMEKFLCRTKIILCAYIHTYVIFKTKIIIVACI